MSKDFENQSFDPKRDLTISRLIKAPRSVVWSAWTDPAKFAQWWLPEPAKCRVLAMEVRPGGAMVTEMSEDGGAFVPHMNACFLAVDEGKRIVFTNALEGGWRPAEQAFMTAVITLADNDQGTDYVARVMHKSSADRDMHEEMGFHEGWGTVIGQLARLVER